MQNFFTCDFLLLKLEASIFAFAKKPLLLFRSWTGNFKVDKLQFLCRQGINLKVPNYTNFFWATFFVLYEPLNSQQGLVKPPTGLEMVISHLCSLVYIVVLLLTASITLEVKSNSQSFYSVETFRRPLRSLHLNQLSVASFPLQFQFLKTGTNEAF